MKKLISLVVLSFVACAHQEAIIGSKNELIGLVTTSNGAAPPSAGRVFVAYEVATADPDHVYFQEVGSLTATGFEISLGSAPPADAANVQGTESFAVGPLLAFAPTSAAGSGALSGSVKDALYNSAIGGSPRYAIIHRPVGGESTLLPWLSAFPQGYSCGRGVVNQGAKESFEPVDCAHVEIQIAPVQTLQFVDWH